MASTELVYEIPKKGKRLVEPLTIRLDDRVITATPPKRWHWMNLVSAFTGDLTPIGDRIYHTNVFLSSCLDYDDATYIKALINDEESGFDYEDVMAIIGMIAGRWTPGFSKELTRIGVAPEEIDVDKFTLVETEGKDDDIEVSDPAAGGKKLKATVTKPRKTAAAS